MVLGLDEGLLDDLWNFPSTFGRSCAEALANLRNTLAAFGDASIASSNPIAQLDHVITYRAISVHAYLAEISNLHRRRGIRWFPISSLPQAAISQLARKIAQQVF
jgi:adenine-specific DNA glycosylase